MAVGSSENLSPPITLKKTHQYFGLNPDAATRIQSELEEIDRKGSEGALENPIFKAANELADKTHKDKLTGLYNRDYLDQTINSFNPEGDHNNLGVVFIDLNFLKQINDSKGHDTGDKLIKLTADILKKVFRSGDILSFIKDTKGTGLTNPSENTSTISENEIPSEEPKKKHLISRRGGDEFVILCHNSRKNPDFKNIFTEAITSRLNEAVSQYNQNRDKEKDLELSISFGTAVYNKEIDSNNLSQTISRAEDIMYAQKKAMHAGRE